MATLDSVIETGKFSGPNGSADPFRVAAESLRRLRTVRATNPGFDEVVSRVIRLPLPEVPTWAPWREIRLCDAIPKLSVARRLGAFNQMLGDVADRFAGDDNRAGFLTHLPLVLSSLRATDHQDATLRLFQKAEAGGAANNVMYAMLRAVPLQRLNPTCRLTVFNEMIRLGSNLSVRSRTWLADAEGQKWINALDPQHQPHARTQIASLRPSPSALAGLSWFGS
jgi:hypothetical protein